MKLNFISLQTEIFKLLGNKKIMVLATSYDNRVTARSMSCIILNNKIYFQTDKTFLKYQQILNNPNVALCIDNIQIEGTANIRKHPFEEENKEFTKAFEKNYKSSYDSYTNLENEVVVEVEPLFITLWKYENGYPFRDFLDVSKKNAFREFYKIKI